MPRVGKGVPGDDDGHLVDIRFEEYGYLITTPTVPDEEKEQITFDEIINRNSKKTYAGFGAPSMRALRQGDKLQVMRQGYFIVDAALGDNSPLVLIKIPDGKPSTL